MAKKPDTYLEEMEEIPPYMCWVLARHPNRNPITQAEIVQRTGWDAKKVERFCGLKSWRGVKIEDVDSFRSACGVTRTNARRHRAYLKRTLDPNTTVNGLTHMRKRPMPAQTRIIRLVTTT